jgi:hypothetical protein
MLESFDQGWRMDRLRFSIRTAGRARAPSAQAEETRGAKIGLVGL